MLRIQSRSFQFSVASNCDAVHCETDSEIVGVLHEAGDIAEVAALGFQRAHQPAGLADEVDHVLEIVDLRRHRQAVLDVGMALADHLQIDGQHQRTALRLDGALDQLLDEAAILHDIELKPERLLDILGEVLDRIDRHRRERIGNAARLRGAAGVNFAVAILHAGGADRRADQRHGGLLAEDRGRGVAVGDIDQDTLAEFQLLQIRGIGAERILAIGAVVDIIEERLRHVALVFKTKIFDAGDMLHEVPSRSCNCLYWDVI